MSLILQSSIAVITSLGLILSKAAFRRGYLGLQGHIQALVVATIEFQKSQSYFAGATQLANLVYFSRQSYYSSPDVMDETFLYTLATNGFIPPVFILVIINRFGRQSWYLTLLAGSIFAVSTAALMTTQSYWKSAPRAFAGLNIFTDPFPRPTTCGFDSGFAENDANRFSSLLCGHNKQSLKRALRPTWAVNFIWFTWFNALLWYLYCLMTKILCMTSVRTRISKFLQDQWCDGPPPVRAWTAYFSRYREISWHALFIITWTVSFGLQFYLYSLPLRNLTVDTSWGFGQIVSVAIWAPCLAEFLNLEISKHLLKS